MIIYMIIYAISGLCYIKMVLYQYFIRVMLYQSSASLFLIFFRVRQN